MNEVREEMQGEAVTVGVTETFPHTKGGRKDTWRDSVKEILDYNWGFNVPA